MYRSPSLRTATSPKEPRSRSTAPSPEWVERTLWALVYAASEAADDGTLAPHEALPTLLRTLERGVACSG